MTAIRGTAPGGAGRNGMPEPGGYVYRGRGFDVLEAGRSGYCQECGEHFQSRVHRIKCLGLQPRRRIAECGTTGGYRRHIRLGQAPCDPCSHAQTAYMTDYRSR